MFGPDYGDCWYAIPGAPGLELSGDLRLRGPRGPRRLRRDANGRPYVLARVEGRRPGHVGTRERRVMLHRAVMAVLLGRLLGADEFVCHRDDDPRNNRPTNLYLGDRRSNAADALRNGRHATGSRHPRAKLSDEQVRQVRRALGRGERGRDLARAFGVHKSTISRIKHGVRRRAR